MRLLIQKQPDGSYSALINDNITQMFKNAEEIGAYIASNPTEMPDTAPETIKQPEPVSYKDKLDHTPKAKHA